MDQATPEQTTDREQLHELAQQLRVDSVRAAAAAGSGHPTSSMSAADLMAVLMSGYLRYDFGAPENRANDHLVFSKGHASPLLYSMYKLAGAITTRSCSPSASSARGSRATRRRRSPGSTSRPARSARGSRSRSGSRSPAPASSTPISGSGSSAATPSSPRARCGRPSSTPGNEGLSNLIAIVDVNRLGQRGPTMHEWDTASWAARVAACGWDVQEIDGHDLEAIDAAYAAAVAADRPAAIFARTKKGSGVAAVEDKEGWHGKPLEDPEAAVAELGGERSLRVEVSAARAAPPSSEIARAAVERPSYEVGEKVATRGAYGDALAWLGSIDERVVALDGEVGNSTYAERFAAKHPDRFFEMYIAEQQMVAAAVGMQTRGWKPFASSFGAFLSRAYDFVRMAAISEADLKLCGSHVGVSIGPDGPSQMALEDIASLRAVLGSVVLYPSDPNQTVALLDAMREHRGISYMRTTRGALPDALRPRRELRDRRQPARSAPSDDDAVTLIGAGHHPPRMPRRGRRARRTGDRRPGDRPLLGEAGRRRGDPPGGRRHPGAVTVEDHWPEGGIGETVAGVLAARRLADAAEQARGRGPARAAGRPEELLAAAGIDAAGIVSSRRPPRS